MKKVDIRCTGIFELLSLNEEIRELIIEKASSEKIQEAQKDQV